MTTSSAAKKSCLATIRQSDLLNPKRCCRGPVIPLAPESEGYPLNLHHALVGGNSFALNLQCAVSHEEEGVYHLRSVPA